jgi:hypothetical protein
MSDLCCKGCDRVFNSSSGHYKHARSCKALIKVTQLENDLRLLKAVTNVTNRYKFMEENTELIPKDYLKKCVLLGRNGLTRLCYYFYFAIPENRTVMYAEQKGKLWIWEERGWTLEDKRDSLEMMLEKTFAFQANTYAIIKDASTNEKLELWYNPHSKYYFLNEDKTQFMSELDAFITDFFTRKTLSSNFLPSKMKIIPPESDDDDSA